MKKIPVGATISFAYQFAFGDFLRILGVMWPAMLLMWVPSILMQPQMMALSGQMAARNYSGLGQLLPLIGLFYVVAFVLIFMQIIGIAQLALDRHKGPVWFYFSFSKAMWRLIGSFLLLLVVIIAGWMAVVLGGVSAGALLGVFAKGASNLVARLLAVLVGGLVMFILWCGYLYCLVRLSFLVTPVIAAEEEGFALGRSWTLGKGNFWRMFAVMLVILLPLILLEGLLFGLIFQGMPTPPQHPTAEQAAAFQTAMNTHMLETFGAISHYWYIAYPVFLAFMIVFYGSLVGAQCFAYQALTEDEASAAVAFD
jgi:hypothetical protein